MSADYCICLHAFTTDDSLDFNWVADGGDDFIVITYTPELIEILLACGDEGLGRA